MINLLKSKGYVFVDRDELNNREFRESNKTFEINTDQSPFDKRAYDLTEEFEIFFDKKYYRTALIEQIIDDTRDESYDNFSIEVEPQERGYLVTITTIMEGVK